MYIMNRRTKSISRARFVLVSLLAVGVLASSAAAARQYIDTDTKISATPEPVVTKVLGAKSKTRTVKTGPGNIISIDLPKDWEQFSPDSLTASTPVLDGSYSWRNTIGNRGVRVITIYIDTVPNDLPLNRVLAVQAVDNRIVALGNVSDNCTNFSGQGRQMTGSGRSPARWEGVQFTCDAANYGRNVVGISSAATPGAVKLTGVSGSRQISIVYTDADATPKQALFAAAIESFRLN